MRTRPCAADQQFGVFTSGQASAAGWTRLQLSRAVADGSMIRLRRGAFCEAALLAEAANSLAARDQLVGLAGVAAALRIPRVSVGYASALSLHGLPLLAPSPVPCVILIPPLRTREADLHVHRHPVPTSQLRCHFDLTITSAARSCYDLGREAGLAAALVSADAALRLGRATRAEFAAVYASLRGRAGWPDGKRLAELVDARSESPLESISRLALTGPKAAPEPQVTVRRPDGSFLARVDFLWHEQGVVGEADGRTKYSGEELWHEKQREAALTELGLLVVRWDWQIARQPAVLRARVEAAFARARLLRSAGITPTYLRTAV